MFKHIQRSLIATWCGKLGTAGPEPALILAPTAGKSVGVQMASSRAETSQLDVVNTIYIPHMFTLRGIQSVDVAVAHRSSSCAGACLAGGLLGPAGIT